VLARRAHGLLLLAPSVGPTLGVLGALCPIYTLTHTELIVT
jgi:hypothetical protein